MDTITKKYKLPKSFEKLSTPNFFKNTATILGYSNIYFHEAKISGQKFLFAKINDFVEDEHDHIARVLKQQDFVQYEKYFKSIHGQNIPLIVKHKIGVNELRGTYVNILAANVVLVKFFNQFKFGDCLQLVYNDMYFNQDITVQNDLYVREKEITDKYNETLGIAKKQDTMIYKLKTTTDRIKEETDGMI
jgi:hypothetical protein